jgi:hypothetical protein
MAYGFQIAATLERTGSLTGVLYARTMLWQYLFRRIFLG